MTRRLRSSKFWLLNRALLLIIGISLAGVALAQTAQKRPHAGTEEDPVFQDYRGIKLGWVADEVRKKLGNPANKSDEQDYYEFSDNEKCSVYYDKATKQVTAISVDFIGAGTGVITPQQVFGAEIEAKSDGSKSRLVRYPKAGYWVSYSRTAGDNPIISVTMQKLPPQ